MRSFANLLTSMLQYAYGVWGAWGCGMWDFLYTEVWGMGVGYGKEFDFNECGMWVFLFVRGLGGRCWI
jgi:hypothetical protein